jgi:L-threonylcarbamoyladenylate synthase
METKILKINKHKPEKDKIKYAANVLRQGGTVAFPTETVYGLGADALNEKAVEKIFAAKGRPADNPLIVHISDVTEVDKLAKSISDTARILMKTFWPGPLTIIMEKAPCVPDIVTAGLNTVAIRLPSNKIALELIKESGVPVAAPSANTSGKPSPTKASHVIDDLKDRVDIIIDGGDAEVGVESTVIDMTSEIPVILRPGGVTYEELVTVIENVNINKELNIKDDENNIPLCPGMKYRHYSPKADLIIVEGHKEMITDKINELTCNDKKEGLKVGILATKGTEHIYNADYVVSVGDDEKPETIAANLFSRLREFDDKGVDIIYAQAISEKGIGMAIKNRLEKAAVKILKV